MSEVELTLPDPAWVNLHSIEHHDEGGQTTVCWLVLSTELRCQPEVTIHVTCAGEQTQLIWHQRLRVRQQT